MDQKGDTTAAIPAGFADISLWALAASERQALLAALEGEAARGLRPRRAEDLRLLLELLGEGHAPIPWAGGAYIAADSRAGAHPLHATGAYYLQEPSAMAAVTALDARPGERVLDLCAAPGGKSTQLGAALAGQGVLVANEIVPSRAKVLSQNIERMGVPNAVVTNESPDRLAARWGAWFDRVLVDAPCSGEGMFRREPDTRREWTPQSPQGCAARQRQILDAAAALVAPGGVLVYSTCTFNTPENEETIEAFLAAHPAFCAEDFALAGVGQSVRGCLRLWPHRLRGEGHFVARMKREGTPREAAEDTPGRVRLEVVSPAYGSAEMTGRLHEAGSRVWVLPWDCPPLDGVRVLRSGLAVGERRGKVTVPDHAAAMALPLGKVAQAVEVDGEMAARYLRGETLPAASLAPGWTVITYQGYALGWAKCVDEMLKNHLPKGLRRM